MFGANFAVSSADPPWNIFRGVSYPSGSELERRHQFAGEDKEHTAYECLSG